jgi:hypothetical protein
MTLNAADMAILLRELGYCVRSAIVRVIINEDHLPCDSDENAAQTLHQFMNIAPLVKCRDNDREFSHDATVLSGPIRARRHLGLPTCPTVESVAVA